MKPGAALRTPSKCAGPRLPVSPMSRGQEGSWEQNHPTVCGSCRLPGRTGASGGCSPGVPAPSVPGGRHGLRSSPRLPGKRPGGRPAGSPCTQPVPSSHASCARRPHPPPSARSLGLALGGYETTTRYLGKQTREWSSRPPGLQGLPPVFGPTCHKIHLGLHCGSFCLLNAWALIRNRHRPQQVAPSPLGLPRSEIALPGQGAQVGLHSTPDRKALKEAALRTSL